MSWKQMPYYAGVLGYVFLRRSYQQTKQKNALEAFRSTPNPTDKEASYWVWKTEQDNEQLKATLFYKGTSFYEASYQKETNEWADRPLPFASLSSEEQKRLFRQCQALFENRLETKETADKTSFISESERRAIRQLKKGLHQIKQRNRQDLLHNKRGEGDA